MQKQLGLFFIVLQGVLSADPGLINKNTRPLQAESNLDALEPWETPIASFFIRSHHGVPTVSADWEITIDGAIEKPLKISLKDLQKYPQKTFHAVLECSGNGRALQLPKVAGIQWEKGAVGNAEWTGVSLEAILKSTQIRSKVKFVRIEGADIPAFPTVPAFVRSIPIEKFLAPDTILALKMNREDLPILHGGPVRLVLPNWYAHNWVKWIKKITFTEEEDPGFFMKKGYRMPKTQVKPLDQWDSSTGNPITTIRVQSFILHPRAEEKIELGVLKVTGKTFSGSGFISKLEISIDGGKKWQLADLQPFQTKGGWQSFEALIEAKKTGKMVVMSKATDSAGNTQPMMADWNPSGYLWNAIDKVPITIIQSKKTDLVAKNIVANRCLVCHTQGILESQILSKKGWEKVLLKMEKFGAQLTTEEKKSLITYFLTSSRHNQQNLFINYALQNSDHKISSSNPEKILAGQKSFVDHCASCHGEKAEGKIGPALKGRYIKETDFYDILSKGVRNMPSFEGRLDRAQITSIREFLIQ